MIQTARINHLAHAHVERESYMQSEGTDMHRVSIATKTYAPLEFLAEMQSQRESNYATCRAHAHSMVRPLAVKCTLIPENKWRRQVKKESEQKLLSVQSCTCACASSFWARQSTETLGPKELLVQRQRA